jgi:hypothetical protein
LVTNFGSTCDRTPEEFSRWSAEELENVHPANISRVAPPRNAVPRLTVVDLPAPQPITQDRLWRAVQARRFAEMALQDAEKMEDAIARDLEAGAVVELGPLRFDRTMQEVRQHTGT